MKKNINLINLINLIIKTLTLISISLLVIIGLKNNKTKSYNSEQRNVEIYIASSDEYYFEEVFSNFEHFRMDHTAADVKVVLYEKNKVFVMYTNDRNVEIYHQNNFYYVIIIRK